VADGAAALADGAAPLAAGVAGAAEGAGALADGTAQLAAGVEQLTSGVDAVAGGAGDAAQGADDLAAGTGQLTTGAGSLSEGVAQLAGGLEEGAAQVPDYDLHQREQLVAVASQPVAVSIDEPPTFERAVAYLGALALGVGGLVTFLLLRPVPARALSSRAGAFRLASRSFGPAAAVVGLQSLLVTGVLTSALDLGALRSLAVGGAVLVAGSPSSPSTRRWWHGWEARAGWSPWPWSP
jgi:putative membrane protein